MDLSYSNSVDWGFITVVKALYAKGVVMKSWLFLFVITLNSNVYADDSAAEKVCNAHVDVLAQAKCFKEFFPTKKVHPSESKEIYDSISSSELNHALDIIQTAFVGKHSKTSIKRRLDKAMTLYNTPKTLMNYNRCASSLVAMRQHSGHSEMDILQYMIKMHSQNTNFNFANGAAYAAVLMGD